MSALNRLGLVTAFSIFSIPTNSAVGQTNSVDLLESMFAYASAFGPPDPSNQSPDPVSAWPSGSPYVGFANCNFC